MNEEDVAVQKNFIRGVMPKVLCLDLEISPMLSYNYGAYESNALKVLIHPMIVAYAYSWGEGIYAKTLNEYAGYKPGILNLNDREIVGDLHALMEEADFIYGHNVRDFDIKHAKARFVFHGYPVSKKWFIEDTLKIARKYFRFPKNNLNELTELLGIGTKTEVKHSDVIWGCIDGDEKKWLAMKAYVIQDINISMGLYKKLAPWHETHFNMNLIARMGNACPVCLSNNQMKYGQRPKAGGIFQRWACRDCGKQWLGDKIAHAHRAEMPLDETERVTQSNP